jgi:hypothetical protein
MGEWSPLTPLTIAGNGMENRPEDWTWERYVFSTQDVMGISPDVTGSHNGPGVWSDDLVGDVPFQFIRANNAVSSPSDKAMVQLVGRHGPSGIWIAVDGTHPVGVTCASGQLPPELPRHPRVLGAMIYVPGRANYHLYMQSVSDRTFGGRDWFANPNEVTQLPYVTAAIQQRPATPDEAMAMLDLETRGKIHAPAQVIKYRWQNHYRALYEAERFDASLASPVFAVGRDWTWWKPLFADLLIARDPALGAAWTIVNTNHGYLEHFRSIELMDRLAARVISRDLDQSRPRDLDDRHLAGRGAATRGTTHGQGAVMSAPSWRQAAWPPRFWTLLLSADASWAWLERALELRPELASDTPFILDRTDLGQVNPMFVCDPHGWTRHPVLRQIGARFSRAPGVLLDSASAEERALMAQNLFLDAHSASVLAKDPDEEVSTPARRRLLDLMTAGQPA